MTDHLPPVGSPQVGATPGAIDALVVAESGSGFTLTACWLEGPRDDEVLVRIASVGRCHTDLGIAAGYLLNFPFPAVLGHKGAGIVEAVGANVTSVTVGDHVVITGPRCQHCRFCLDGRPAYCQRADELVFACQRDHGLTALTRKVPGVQERVASHFFGQSSFASYAVADAAGVVAIDSSMPLHLAAPLDCGVVTGWGTVVNHLRVRTADTVAVIGFGGVSSAAAAAALAQGAKDVVVEPSVNKRAIATSLGASALSSEGDVVSDVRDATNGGADHVVCTIGDIEASAAASVSGGDIIKAVLIPNHDGSTVSPETGPR